MSIKTFENNFAKAKGKQKQIFFALIFASEVLAELTKRYHELLDKMREYKLGM